jgi:hypothetical protein
VIRNANEVRAFEQPSRKGGRSASKSSISAAISRLLAGIHFPKSKHSLKDYAKKNISSINSYHSNQILNTLNRLPEREYRNMADVEKSVGDII